MTAKAGLHVLAVESRKLESLEFGVSLTSKSIIQRISTYAAHNRRVINPLLRATEDRGIDVEEGSK
jgi:hypothetical protein